MSTTLNWNRIILGGVAAGVVILLIDMLVMGGLFNAQVNAALAGLGKDFEAGGLGSLALFIATSLVIGLAATWLYAAIRPCYGAGPRTAAIAGLCIWTTVYLIAGLGYLSMDLFPASFVGLTVGIGLVESILATLVGAYLYRE